MALLDAEEAMQSEEMEALSKSTAEYRNIINIQSKEVEHLKSQLVMTTKLFERIGVKSLLEMLKADEIDIRRTATRAIANLAGDGTWFCCKLLFWPYADRY